MTTFKSCTLLLLMVAAKTLAGVEFEVAELLNATVPEGTATLTLQRSEASPADVRVILMTLQQFSDRDRNNPANCQLTLEDLGVADISAVDPAEVSDFSAEAVDVSFGEEDRSRSFSILITDDDIAERSELLVALIDGPASGNCALLLIISDDDVVRFRFNSPELTIPTLSANETFSGLRLMKIGSNEPELTITIQNRLGSAMLGVDYIIRTTSFTFSSSTESVEIPIEIIDDDISENVENIVLCLPTDFTGSEVMVESLSPECSTLVLFDDDVLVVGFQGRTETRPVIDIPEGTGSEICIGIIGGSFTVGGFFEILATLLPLQPGPRDVRLSVSATLFGTIGPTPTTLQVAEQLMQQCFTATAADNDIVDGNTFFEIYLELVGTTVSQSQPVFLGSNNATLVIRDNDVNSFSITLDNTGQSPTVTAREAADNTGTVTFTINKMGPETNLTYIVTLDTEPPHNNDFIFGPIVFDPSTRSQPLSYSVANDEIPESVERYEIIISTITIADGEGLTPLISSDTVPVVSIYDNDFAVGFDITMPMTVDEGTSHVLNLSILEPGGEDIDPLASLPFTLTLEASGGIVARLETQRVELNSDSPSAMIRIVFHDDDVCNTQMEFTLISTYDGSAAYTVLNNQAILNLKIVDDDCVTTTTAGTGTDGVDSIAKPQTACIACIVVPVVIVFFLLLLLCLFLICCLWFCVLKRCWHTYDTERREKKYGRVV